MSSLHFLWEPNLERRYLQGLRLDNSTGLITGTPATAERYFIAIQVTNGCDNERA